MNKKLIDSFLDAKKADREDEEKRLRRKLLEKQARKRQLSGNGDDDEPLSVQPMDQMHKKRARSPIRFPSKNSRDRDQPTSRHRPDPQHERQRHHRDRLDSGDKKGSLFVLLYITYGSRLMYMNLFERKVIIFPLLCSILKRILFQSSKIFYQH